MNFTKLSEICITQENYPLAGISSMKTGGAARYAAFPSDVDELRDAVSFIKSSNIKYCIIGNASNVLFPDQGYDGVIVFTNHMKAINIMSNDDDGDALIYADAGVSLTMFSGKTLRDGYAGLEFAYGIPASVGGAIYMNAGAYGGEMSQVLEWVEYIDENCELKIDYNNRSDGRYSYRHSPFMDMPGCIIVGGCFRLKSDSSGEAFAAAEKNMASRKEKQPLEYPSCGSTFKRPTGYFAGALIEQAGLKGVSVGGACVSEKHAGFIINKGGATTNDVLELMKNVSDKVYDAFGVRLEPEIRVIE